VAPLWHRRCQNRIVDRAQPIANGASNNTINKGRCVAFESFDTMQVDRVGDCDARMTKSARRSAKARRAPAGELRNAPREKREKPGNDRM
jgi:hypothetical protein